MFPFKGNDSDVISTNVLRIVPLGSIAIHGILLLRWLRAWDTFATMKLWRREVVSSASMAEWLRAWDTSVMMKLWRREVASSASAAEWLRAWNTSWPR